MGFAEHARVVIVAVPAILFQPAYLPLTIGFCGSLGQFVHQTSGCLCPVN